MGTVVCLGSINVDIVATVGRFPRPGETVMGNLLARYPGGKGANQAIAAARAGAATQMAGAVGDDDDGRWMCAQLRAAGVDVTRVRTAPAKPTGAAIIRVCAAENDIVVIAGANGSVDAADVEGLSLGPGDVLLCQLEVPVIAVRAAMDRARRAGATTILNAAPAIEGARTLLAYTDILIVNETELSTLSGATVTGRSSPEAVAQAASILQTNGSPSVVTTLGVHGAVVTEAGRLHALPGHQVDAVDATGAGDCYCGTLAAALASGAELVAAATLANAAAALSVTRAGAGSSMPERGEVDRFLAVVSHRAQPRNGQSY